MRYFSLNGQKDITNVLKSLCTERLIQLLHEFPSDEPTRKRYINEIISWSGRFGPLERGDAELHHAAGSVYAEGRWRCISLSLSLFFFFFFFNIIFLTASFQITNPTRPRSTSSLVH